MALIILFPILLYTLQIPFKRRYHWIFIIFVIDLVGWSSFATFGQLAENLETVTERTRWTQALSTAPQWALLYHFTLLYVRPRTPLIKYTILVPYGYVLIWWGMLLLAPSLLITPARLTSTGLAVGGGSLTPFLNPFGISLITLLVSIPILIRFLRFHRSLQSQVSKKQVSYLIVGILVLAIGWNQITIARYISSINFLSLFVAASAVIFLIGIRKHGFLSITPQSEIHSEIPLRFNLAQGSSYLAIEPEPKQSFEIFSNLAMNGHYGICIIRSIPDNIRATYRLKTTPILWLTEEKSDDAVAPSDLHGLFETVKAFIERAERPVVILQGIGYLASINGFRAVLRLMARLSDVNLQRNGIMIFSATPGTLTERQIVMLGEECPSLQRLEVSQSGEAIISPLRPAQEIHPLLMKNATVPAQTHAQEPSSEQKGPLQFKQEHAEKAFQFLAKAFLQDYTVNRVSMDSAGWRTAMEIAEGTKLPAYRMYGKAGSSGTALAEPLKRGLIETRWFPGERGRGGTVMRIRANYANPYVKEEIDRIAREPRQP